LPPASPSIEFVESGSGPPLLFLPGSFSTPAAWRALHKALPPGWRLAATSLCGYGATAERRLPADTAMAHEVAVVVEAARRLGGPVHLVGHSFGGTVALAAALSGAVAVASLALFEANPLALLRPGNPALHAEAVDLSRRFAAAVAAGDPAAPGLIIDYWGGPGSFAALPAAVRDYCRQTAPANVLDWPCCLGFQAGPADYAGLRAPVLLARGARANPAMVAITGALAASLPRCRTAVVEDAGHFLISSHPAACAALLADFLGGLASSE
jgi:pimeloyl-ACP methyl ester carboxylesterase